MIKYVAVLVFISGCLLSNKRESLNYTIDETILYSKLENYYNDLIYDGSNDVPILYIGNKKETYHFDVPFLHMPLPPPPPLNWQSKKSFTTVKDVVSELIAKKKLAYEEMHPDSIAYHNTAKPNQKKIKINIFDFQIIGKFYPCVVENISDSAIYMGHSYALECILEKQFEDSWIGTQSPRFMGCGTGRVHLILLPGEIMIVAVPRLAYNNKTKYRLRINDAKSNPYK